MGAPMPFRPIFFGMERAHFKLCHYPMETKTGLEAATGDF
jgi:hypothetical protein